MDSSTIPRSFGWSFGPSPEIPFPGLPFTFLKNNLLQEKDGKILCGQGEVRQNQMEGIMIEVLPESHDNILGVKNIGKLPDLAYKTTLVPRLEGMIRDYQKSPVPLPDAASVI
jgi:hypothetical protein